MLMKEPTCAFPLLENSVSSQWGDGSNVGHLDCTSWLDMARNSILCVVD